MGKTITTGYISDVINGIKVNSGIKCHSSNYKNESSRTVNYVVMHYTGNAKDIAKNNANYFASANRSASSHFFVDDNEIYQSVELRDTAWHCGANTYYHNVCRNANSIGIEMCCTGGNYKISEVTKKNAASLCAYICNILGITANEVDTYVLRHYDVTHKQCPLQMSGANNSEWIAFKSMVKDILNGISTSTPTPSASTTSSSTYTVVKGDTLSDIGTKFGISWTTIADLNGIKSPYTINVGQVLKLPTSNSSSTSTSSTTSTSSDVKDKSATSASTTTSISYTKTQFIKDVQGAIGAKVDGVAGSETLSKTVTVSKSKNNKHAVVKPIQKYLNAMGYNCGTEDGIAGSKFDTAVKAYQKANGLVADGEITAKANTWKKLLGL